MKHFSEFFLVKTTLLNEYLVKSIFVQRIESTWYGLLKNIFFFLSKRRKEIKLFKKNSKNG